MKLNARKGFIVGCFSSCLRRLNVQHEARLLRTIRQARSVRPSTRRCLIEALNQRIEQFRTAIKEQQLRQQTQATILVAMGTCRSLPQFDKELARKGIDTVLRPVDADRILRIKKGGIIRACHFFYRLSERFILEAKDRNAWRQDICKKVNLNQGTFAKKYTQAKTYEYQKFRKNIFAEELDEVIKEHSEVIISTK